MKIGVPREIKADEHRVGLLPAAVKEVVLHGHDVVVETGAGAGTGHDDASYAEAGASIAADAAVVFDTADLIVKVKEPQASERARLREEQALFTYLHLAPDRPQTTELMASGATCIAYETVTDAAGRLPLLAPMSEVAGRMSVQAAALCLEKVHGGSGLLMSGVPGTPPARVVVIGGGVVGQNAARIALGLGADVTVLDRSPDVLRDIDQRFEGHVKTLFSTTAAIEAQVIAADAVIGAVLIPGAAAPRLVTRAMVARMRPGSALVDVSIDQGGCFETSKATTHHEPTFVVDGVVHYCVANMPGAVALTSAAALGNATLPYILRLADGGITRTLQNDRHLRAGLNVYRGLVTNESVAQAHGFDFVDPDAALTSRT